MAYTSYRPPRTAANVDRNGKEAWLNPNNAKTNDANFAHVVAVKDDYNDWLRLTNFGFSTSDIPDGSIIDGIKVQYKRKSDAENVINDSAIYLRKTSGQVGENKASATYYATSKETKTYGGASDDWNAGLSDSDVRSSNFGIDLSIFNDGGLAPIASIYFCQIRIYYTPGATTAYLDIPTRFKLWVQQFTDIPTRFKLEVQNFTDIATRFILWVTRDAATRFILHVQNYADTATRFVLRALAYKDIATRFKLHVKNYVDTATRFVLQVTTDIATRFKLGVQNYIDTATRFKLGVQNFTDIPTRFKLEVQGFTDIATKFILLVRSYIDIATRYQVVVGRYANVSTRFQLRATGAFPVIGGRHIINVVGD